MKRGNKRQRQFHIWLSIGLLAFLLLLQISIRLQSARNLSVYLDYMIKEEEQEDKQARITEDTHAGQVIIYVTKDMAGGQLTSLEDTWRFRGAILLFAIARSALLLLILTGFLIPKQKFIRKLEENSCDRRSGPLLVWHQHLRDGEKEVRYNFGRIA